jgi:hypothetical protein
LDAESRRVQRFQPATSERVCSMLQQLYGMRRIANCSEG